MTEDNDPTSDMTQETDGILGVQGHSKWQHALLILLFAFIYQISEIVFAAVAIFQVVCLLLTGARNDNLNDFSIRLTDYMYLVLQYVCLSSSKTPWPLDKPNNTIEIAKY